MPLTVIIVCSTLNIAMMSMVYFGRFHRLRHTSYQIHPLVPTAWMIYNVLAMMFLAASGNIAMIVSGLLALVYQAVFLVMGVKKNAHMKKLDWKIEIEDYICFGLAIVAAILYRTTGDLMLGALIIMIGSCLSDTPQLRKAFVAPHTDAVSLYMMSAIRCIIQTGMLSSLNFVGLSQTLYMAFFGFAETAWLVYCKRRQVVRTRTLVTEALEVTSGER